MSDYVISSEMRNWIHSRAVWKLYTFDRELIRVPSSIKEELVLETISLFLFVPWGAVVWGGVSITVLFTFHHYHTWVLLFYLELHYFEGGHYYTMQCIRYMYRNKHSNSNLFSLYSFGLNYKNPKYEKDLLNNFTRDFKCY